MLDVRDVVTWILVASTGLLGACTPGPEKTPTPSPSVPGLPPDAQAAAEVIQARTLAEVVTALAHDDLRGRGPSTEGDRQARRIIAESLQSAGFEPGAPGGSWEQPFGLVSLTSTMPERWRFRANDKSLELSWWEEYVATSGVQRESVEIRDAEIVFVGYGITAPEEDWDDFKGTDLAGKIVLMLNNDPDWDPTLFAGERRLYYGRWTYKYESAARQRAAGAIIIHTEPSAGYPFQVVQAGWSGEQFELPAEDDEQRLPLNAWVTDAAARKLVALGGHDLDTLTQSARSRDFRPVPLGVSSSIRFANAVDDRSETANVLGLLRGRDPQLRDELVVYTAHHDHLGQGRPDESGDEIYNGARDNASGVATVLDVARAFAALERRPRRSILMLLVGAEEQGLLGSRYFAANPTVPPRQIAANLNFDSANIFGPTRDVAIIGRGKSSLEDLLESAARLQDRIVVDEPFPDKGYYYRSDQFSLAKIGVPALYFKAGTDLTGRPPGWGREAEDRWRAERYHRPGDEIYEEWNFAGMVEDARLAFWVGLSVAETDELPTWRPGDEFESIRERRR